MNTAASLEQENDAQEQLAIRVLGKERYGSSACQAHPLELVEQFIQEQVDRITGFEAKISAAAAASVPDDFEERLAAACIACEVPDPVYEELCVVCPSDQRTPGERLLRINNLNAPTIASVQYVIEHLDSPHLGMASAGLIIAYALSGAANPVSQLRLTHSLLRPQTHKIAGKAAAAI